MDKCPNFAGLIAIGPLVVLRASVTWLEKRQDRIDVSKKGFFFRNRTYTTGFWFFGFKFFKKEKTRTDEELEYLWKNGNEFDWYSPLDRVTYDQELADTITNLSKAAQSAAKANSNVEWVRDYRTMFITDHIAATLNIVDHI